MKNKSENHVRRWEEEEDQGKTGKMIAYLKVKVKNL